MSESRIMLHQTTQARVGAILNDGLRVDRCRRGDAENSRPCIWLSLPSIGGVDLRYRYGEVNLYVRTEGLHLDIPFQPGMIRAIQDLGQWEYICYDDIPPGRIMEARE